MAQPVLALVDASVYWKPVCELAVWASKALNAPVRLLHVLEKSADDITLPHDIVKDIDDRFVTDFIGKIYDSSASYARLMQELGQTVLDDAADYIKKYGETEVETKLRYDGLSDAINFYSKTSSLIIIGKRGQHTAANNMIAKVGDNFETIVRASQRPVLAASQEIKPVTKVLFLYDDLQMNSALDYFLCRHLFGDKSCLLAFSQILSSTISKDIAHFRSRLEQENIQVSSLLLDGDCNEEMLNNIIEDNNIDLIVLSAFNESKFTQLIFGSIHTSLIEKIKVPVLIFRNRDGAK